ncbi:MAG: DUF3617 family protein [Bdellovibrionaceae bacterium]|nr:DUF3617 family protein [Pseudobdellovibrionaceae bacterium]
MKMILLATILFTVVQVSAESFEAGLWKSKESLTLNGIPLPSSEGEECLTKAQTKDARATIQKELEKKGCILTKWLLKSKKLAASIKCDNRDINAAGNLHGAFTSKNYDLQGEAEGKYRNALSARVQIKLSGQWIKSCVK